MTAVNDVQARHAVASQVNGPEELSGEIDATQPNGEFTRGRATGRSEGSLPEAASERGPAVSVEERRRLAVCCAFFKAARYREAAPGSIRQEDIQAVEYEIDAVLRNCGSPAPADRRVG